MTSTERTQAEEQLKRLEAYMERHPSSTAFARLAEAYAEVGELERALKLLEQGLRAHADYLPAHLLRARYLLSINQPFKAEETLRNALAVDPANLSALKMLCELEAKREAAGRGVTARKLAALDAANPIARKVLSEEVQAASPFTTRSVAELYESQGYLSEALRVYRELARRQPDNAELAAKIEELEARLHGTQTS